MKVVVSRLGRTSRCRARDRLQAYKTKYALPSTFVDFRYRIGPAKSTPTTPNAVDPSVLSLGSRPGAGVSRAIAWNRLQPQQDFKYFLYELAEMWDPV